VTAHIFRVSYHSPNPGLATRFDRKQLVVASNRNGEKCAKVARAAITSHE